MADWRAQGNCRGADISIFFAEDDDFFLQREAKRICASCEVREPCLEQALADREKVGVWGGFTATERRRILRRRRRTAA